MSDFKFPRVKVISPSGEHWFGTKCYIDGNQIEKVTGVDFHIEVNEIPQFTFETIGLPDIDMSGRVSFDFTAKTVEESLKVLQNELLKHSDLYNGFVASIRSAIRDTKTEMFDKELAEHIAKRIIGED